MSALLKHVTDFGAECGQTIDQTQHLLAKNSDFLCITKHGDIKGI